MIPIVAKLNGIIFNKCPRCLQTKLFVYKNPYNLKHTTDMHKKCSNCGCTFEKENWFYFGAMYASYGLNVALGVILWFFYYLFFWDLPLHYYLIVLSFSILLLFPVIVRKARVMWLNLFEAYDPNWASK